MSNAMHPHTTVVGQRRDTTGSRRRKAAFGVQLAISLLLSAPIQADEVSVAWKVSPIQPECSQPTDALSRVWSDPAFDDSSWSSATVPFTAGSGAASIFFRGTFTASTATPLWLRAASDDGASIYINGDFIGTYGLGPCSTAGCVNAPNRCANNQCVPAILLPAISLVDGSNTLAIEVWNATPGGYMLSATIQSDDPMACGNCAVDVGEECDPTVIGPACSLNCTLCGNGVLDAGEQCDDGNVRDDDCCSSTCQAASPGAPCPDDLNICTTDTCNGTGVCQHPPRSGSCDDGLFCNGTATCQGGSCVQGSPPCRYQCNENLDQCHIGTCPTVPEECGTSEKSLLKITSRSLSRPHDMLTWKWLRGQFYPFNMGDPTTTTEYAVCVYAGSSSSLVAQATIPASAAYWDPLPDGGFKYLDPNSLEDGITKVTMHGAIGGGMPSMQIKGRGVRLPDVALPLAAPVVAQFIHSDNRTDNVCWESIFTANELLKNDTSRLKAKDLNP